MKYQATFIRKKKNQFSDNDRHKYKNTIIKQTEGCHWYTVMHKINYTPLSFEVIIKTKKKGIVLPS